MTLQESIESIANAVPFPVEILIERVDGMHRSAVGRTQRRSGWTVTLTNWAYRFTDSQSRTSGVIVVGGQNVSLQRATFKAIQAGQNATPARRRAQPLAA